jgi:hypothetical protein
MIMRRTWSLVGAGVFLLAVLIAALLFVGGGSSDGPKGVALPGVNADGDGGSEAFALSGLEPAATGVPQNFPFDNSKSVEQPLPQGITTPAPTAQFGGDVSGVGGGAPQTGGAAPVQLLDRKVIRNATLGLTVGDVVGAMREVEAAAQAAGGFVSNSTLTVQELPKPVDAPEDEPPPKRQSASMTIRVPAESFTNTMTALRGLATEITAETNSSQEVTEEYTDLNSRLRNLEAGEQRYLDLLGRASTIPDILTVQDRLSAVRLEIEQVQGRLQLLDDLTDLATITAQLDLPPLPAEEATAQTAEDRGWAGEAWEDAWEASKDALETIGAAAITAGFILVWALVPLTALLLIWWLIGSRRARKEA